MNSHNPFDEKLALNQRMPHDFRDALIDVADTLDYCWAAARAVFEDQATPEHALKICEMVMAERRRILDTAGQPDRERGDS